jgi:hypothetical protein
MPDEDPNRSVHPPTSLRFLNSRKLDSQSFAYKNIGAILTSLAAHNPAPTLVTGENIAANSKPESGTHTESLARKDFLGHRIVMKMSQRSRGGVYEQGERIVSTFGAARRARVGCGRLI